MRIATRLSADTATASLAKIYLLWFIPGLALQFPLVALGSALRATGIIKPAVGLQVLSVVLNIILAPLFIFGIGPWPRMGVSGAALATFISILIADVLMVLYFEKKYHYLRFRFSQWPPQMKMWWAMLKIGLPAGAEFALWTLYAMIVYVIIRPFGAAAQAGFGVGGRVMQALFLPVLALSFAVSPVVGQNFGGRRADRVRQSVFAAIGLASAMMLVLAITVWLTAPWLIRGFSKDAEVIAYGAEFLTIASLNFLAAGIVFSSSSVFQGIGNTVPPLLSTAVALVAFCIARRVALASAGIPDQTSVVRLGRVAGSAGVFEFVATEAGAGSEAEVRRSVDRRPGVTEVRDRHATERLLLAGFLTKSRLRFQHPPLHADISNLQRHPDAPARARAAARDGLQCVVDVGAVRAASLSPSRSGTVGSDQSQSRAHASALAPGAAGRSGAGR